MQDKYTIVKGKCGQKAVHLPLRVLFQSAIAETLASVYTMGTWAAVSRFRILSHRNSSFL